MWIATNGHEAVGPFSDYSDARFYAERAGQGWHFMRLELPT